MADTGAMLHVSDDLALPADAVTETFLIFGRKGSGKALALETPLPTPSGWTTMGDVGVGDVVFDENGLACRVTLATEVQYGRLCYELTFSDGSSVIADADHLWISDTYASRKADCAAAHRQRPRGRGGRPQCERRAFPQLLTTERIRATLTVPLGRTDVARNHAIRCTKPIQAPAADLTVDPYVLGIWLGDGNTHDAKVTTADPEVLHEIREVGYAVGPPRDVSPSGRSATYRIGAGPDGIPLHRHLRQLGLLHDKHLPEIYLRASESQRRAVLAGLMDSDGSAESRSNSCCFYNKNERLADAVTELAASLGWVARRRKKAAILNGLDHGVCYEVRFRPSTQVFRLPRKAARLSLDVAHSSRHARRMIVSVEPVASVPVRCIQVDSPSHLYLAGRSFIPTHNTATAGVLTEEMITAGLRVAVLDPMDAWWGLRSSADGQGPGLPVLILGGEHGDLPLPPGCGSRVADLFVDEQLPVVLSLFLMSKTQQRTFVCDFMERLFLRNREPMHLVIDEADRWAPQRGNPEGARLLGAYEDIVLRGRRLGIGSTSITLRVAQLNSAIRSQVEVLVAMRMLGKLDVQAIDEWIRLHADEADARELKASLPSLPVGTAWFWSPGGLDLLQKVQVRPRRTFDSSATPKVGQQVITPREFARVDPGDLERLAALMQPAELAEGVPSGGSAVVRGLRRQVTELTAALTAAQSRPPERIEVPVLAPGEMAAFERALAELRGIARGLEVSLSRVARPAPAPLVDETAAPGRTAAAAAARLAPAGPADPDPAPAAGEPLKPGARRVLEVLARRHPLRVTRPQLAALAGMKRTGGAFQSYFSALLRGGFITEDGKLISVTPPGLSEAGAAAGAGPMTAGDLREMWRGILKPKAWAVLECLLAVYPDTRTKAELAEAVGMTASGGAFQGYLTTLSSNDLVSVSSAGVQAADVFFLAEVGSGA